MVAKKEIKIIYAGSEVNGVWYSAEQYPVDNLPPEIKVAIEKGWIEGYFKKREKHATQAG